MVQRAQEVQRAQGVEWRWGVGMGGAARRWDTGTGVGPTVGRVCEPKGVYPAEPTRVDAVGLKRPDAVDIKRADAAASLAADEALDLGDRIADLAQRIQAAEYEMLCLIAEFDDRRAWESAGFGSCAEWLAWRIGCKPNSARERVRAAHALRQLPKTSAAMQSGTLSFSKVRALTRVATQDNEEALLEFAHAGSATNLERVVRAWKALDDREELALEQSRHRERSFSVFVGDDGSYIVKGCLEPEVGAVLMRAVDGAGDALFRREGEGDRDGQRDRDRQREIGLDVDITPAQRRADAVGLLCERALAAGFDGAASGSRAERYQVMLHIEPATLRADVESRRSDLDGVRVCAETARRMACDPSVVDVVEGPREIGGFGDGVGPRSDEIGGEHVTAVTSERRIAHPALRANVLGVGRRTRTTPPALRRALQARDRGCRFPGCDGRFTEAHHVTHWADGGRTEPNNLVLLCRAARPPPRPRSHHSRSHHPPRPPPNPARPSPILARPDGKMSATSPGTSRRGPWKPSMCSPTESRYGSTSAWAQAWSWSGDRHPLVVFDSRSRDPAESCPQRAWRERALT